MKPHTVTFKSRDALINMVVKKIKEGVPQITILNTEGREESNIVKNFSASFKEHHEDNLTPFFFLTQKKRV